MSSAFNSVKSGWCEVWRALSTSFTKLCAALLRLDPYNCIGSWLTDQSLPAEAEMHRCPGHFADVPSQIMTTCYASGPTCIIRSKFSTRLAATQSLALILARDKRAYNLIILA